MICPEAIRLFDLFEQALTAFHAARLRLPDAGDFETRFLNLAAARTAYWKHVQTHGCRTASTDAAADDVEERLRAQIERTRRSYNEASQRCKELMEVSAETGRAPNGALAQAVRVREEEEAKYKADLKQFADYVLRGKLPANNCEDREGSPSTG